MLDATSASRFYHCNKYHAAAACEHCEGIIRHEQWCITLNENVQYAFAAFLDATKLNFGDHVTLQALGALWQDFRQKSQSCAGNCSITGDEPSSTDLISLS